MKITSRIVSEVIDDYLKIVESDPASSKNKIWLVREVSDAVRYGEVDLCKFEEILAKKNDEIDELNERIEELEQLGDDY